MYCRAAIAFLFLLATLGPCVAEDAPQKTPDPAAEQRTLERFGIENKSCIEWSDGCAVCMRQKDEAFACSLPGIACEPVAVTCRHDGQKDLPPETAPK